MDLPWLGVGVAYFSGIEPLLDSSAGVIDFLEVEPQTLWYQPDPGVDTYIVDEQALERLASFPLPKVLHGIGFPVGGSRPPPRTQVPPFHRTMSALDPPWISEHLSFNLAGGPDGEFTTGFLLPPRQTPAGVAAAVGSIRAMADQMPIPLAVEVGTNYLRPRADELPDGAFIGQVVEAADCGLLLDLHNLWTNERNGRQPVRDFLDQIPLERVWEVHIAGGSELQGYWLDSHSGPAPGPVLELAGGILPHLPSLRAVTFELFPDYLPIVGLEGVHAQLQELREMLGRSPSTIGERPNGASRAQTPGLSSPPSPGEWEDTLGALVVGREAAGTLAEELSADPGVWLTKRLLGEFRASMVAGVIKLTSRLIVLAEGRTRFLELLADYWRYAPPERFASAEALGFAGHLRTFKLGIPYLADVLRFEEAVVRTLLDDKERLVPFSHDPLQVLRALAEERLPSSAKKGNFEIAVTPEAGGSDAVDRSGARAFQLPSH